MLINRILQSLLLIVLLVQVNSCITPGRMGQFEPPQLPNPLPSYDVSTTPSNLGRISDYTGLIDSVGHGRILRALDSLNSIEIADIHILLIPSLADQKSSEYATRVFDGWTQIKILNSESILFVISIGDGAIRILSAPELSKSLTHNEIKEIVSKIMLKPFSEGRFADGIVYALNGIGHELVDQHPEPVNGYQDIARHVKYPFVAQELGNEDTVVLSVYIGASGGVLETKVLKGSDYEGFVESSEAAVSNVYWKPAMHHGKAFPMWISVPIVFKLN